jgi:hypothetical protein
MIADLQMQVRRAAFNSAAQQIINSNGHSGKLRDKKIQSTLARANGSGKDVENGDF